MVNKNELRKNITTAAVILFASTVFATAPVNRVYAQEPVVQNIEALAAPVETEKWSSAKVYANARYGQTWSGSNSFTNEVAWEWLNDMNYCFKSVSALTGNGTPLNYQWLKPIDMPCTGQYDTYIAFTDDNEPIRKYFMVGKDIYAEGDHLWNHLVDYLQIVQSWDDTVEAGNTYIHTEEDANYCRYTFNITRRNDYYGTIQKGYFSIVEVKATGEEYSFRYEEQDAYYDDTRALTVIYSALPTGVQ